MQCNGSSIRVQQARYQRGQGGLAASACTHKRHHLPRLHLQVHSLQHALFPSRHPHVGKDKGTGSPRKDGSAPRNGGQPIQDLKHPLRPRQSLLNIRSHGGESLQGHVHHANRHQEGHQFPGLKRPGQDPCTSAVDDQPDPDGGQGLDQWTRNDPGQSGTKEQALLFLVFPFKMCLAHRLPPQGLNHLHPVEALSRTHSEAPQVVQTLAKSQS